MSKINSREKGKRGEREWRDVLRAWGYKARRGQQFSGSPNSPDVVSDLKNIHFEVKLVERLNVHKAMEQAMHDCGEFGTGIPRAPVVAHRASRSEWLITMRASDWLKWVITLFPPLFVERKQHESSSSISFDSDL